MELNPFEFTASLPLEEKEFYSYEDLIVSINDQVNWLVVAGFQDYEGDFFFLGTDQQNCVYYVVSGYGSCSICDSLQACETAEELRELRDALKRKIRNFDSIEEFEGWFNTVAQTEWYNDEDVEHFIQEVKKHFPCTLHWRDN